MNRTEIHWMNELESLPEQMVFIGALPGVGNVGKIIVDALIEEHESECLAWLVHPDFPPHSTMKDGLLHPPRIEIHQVLLPMGLTVIVITGDSQPLTPTGQFELTDKILRMLDEADAELLLILVGLQADVEEQLPKYSPKYNMIINSILKSPGNAFVYTEYKTVEGIAVLGVVLKALIGAIIFGIVQFFV